MLRMTRWARTHTHPTDPHFKAGIPIGGIAGVVPARITTMMTRIQTKRIEEKTRCGWSIRLPSRSVAEWVKLWAVTMISIWVLILLEASGPLMGMILAWPAHLQEVEAKVAGRKGRLRWGAQGSSSIVVDL